LNAAIYSYGTHFPNREYGAEEEAEMLWMLKRGMSADQAIAYVNAGISLSEKQAEWAAATREADRTDGPEEFLIGGARGGGKSSFIFSQLAADDCQRFPGLTCLVLRRIGKRARESLNEIRQTLLQGIPHQYSETKGQITFPNGSKIVTGHFERDSDIDHYLGQSYDVIALEEATQISGNMYLAIRGSLRSSKRHPETGEIWRVRHYASTNPGGPGHAFIKDRFVQPLERDQGRRFLPARVQDNPFVGEQYRRNLEALTGYMRAAWLEGDWDIVAGQYFVTFSTEHHTRNFEITDQERRNWDFWMSFDYGFQHRGVWTLFGQDGDGHAYVIDQCGESHQLTEQHVHSIRAMLSRHQLHFGRIGRIAAGNDCFATKNADDPSALTIAASYAKHQIDGIKIVLRSANDARIQGAQEILRRLGDPRQGIDGSLTIHRRCSQLIGQLQTLQHRQGMPEDVCKKTAEKGDGDDNYDSFRYGLMERTGPKAAQGALI